MVGGEGGGGGNYSTFVYEYITVYVQCTRVFHDLKLTGIINNQPGENKLYTPASSSTLKGQ